MQHRHNSQSDTTRTYGQREDLSDQDPGARSPGGCEEGDGDADERNLSLHHGSVGRVYGCTDDLRGVSKPLHAGLECTLILTATMSWHDSMPSAPKINKGLLPNRSMVQNEIGVEQTLTSVVIRPIKNGLSMVPSCWKNVVPKKKMKLTPVNCSVFRHHKVS